MNILTLRKIVHKATLLPSQFILSTHLQTHERAMNFKLDYLFNQPAS